MVGIAEGAVELELALLVNLEEECGLTLLAPPDSFQADCFLGRTAGLNLQLKVLSNDVTDARIKH